MTRTISASVRLDAPPAAVWATLTDMSRYGDWSVEHVEFPGGPPALAEGARFTEKVALLGASAVISWTVAQLDAPRALALRGAGPLGARIGYRYRLAAAAGGTELDVEAEFGGAALRPFANTLATESAKALDRSLARLCALVPTSARA